MPSTATQPREASVNKPADLTVIRSAAEEAILSAYPTQRDAAPGGAAVVKARDRAFDLLKANGLPTRRVEEWKYTDLRALMRDFPAPAEKPDAATIARADKLKAAVEAGDVSQVSFVNGYDVTSEAPQGVAWQRVSDAKALPVEAVRERAYQDNAAVALNTAFSRDATLLRVAAGTTPARPVKLSFRNVGAAASTFPRVIVTVEKGASLTLIESHDSANELAFQTHALIEIDVAEGASVEYIRVDTSGDKAMTLSTFGLTLAKDATFSSLTVTRGSAVSRQQIFARIHGTGVKAAFRGAALLRGRQHADVTLVTDHAAPHGESREVFKSVLDDQSRSVFQGKIVVQQAAQKTDGKMMTQALLLSEDAEMNAKPELEIFADDVVCGHGATAGALDEDLLFYLRSRGVPHKEAEALLVQAFIGEAIEPIAHEGMREALLDLTRDWLASRATLKG
ncbi:FeS cluster assembly protein SufD [Variibacter gotjawalensis]|uniref:FeS cluster assembly protein SufD n=1 Tax=Variibacter gotjawalensis TaxID=1333996 RepID=A0A0S3PY58_9BRAD|nr:Fe-S cluster assembly protein SufD [Variibacter gotjawalensis]NIK46680.1 Fe-S cluster assembly protein SufD [Variibacter gotjawalensis]RZS48583.1 iron-regulated ABC transporter permease protein SufD [Variibacter gotjawalensis]BAT60845.1 FeS cluster assembly protein SufD [Variibacter gotjawalensis]